MKLVDFIEQLRQASDKYPGVDVQFFMRDPRTVFTHATPFTIKLNESGEPRSVEVLLQEV